MESQHSTFEPDTPILLSAPSGFYRGLVMRALSGGFSDPFERTMGQIAHLLYGGKPPEGDYKD